MVVQFSVIRWLITFRRGDIGARATAPQRAKSMGSDVGLTAILGATGAVAASVSNRWTWARKSARTTRPPRSLPRTRAKSMPNSRATLRTDGAAAAGVAPGFASGEIDSPNASNATTGAGVVAAGTVIGAGTAADGTTAVAPLSAIERIT